jgi:DNA-binding PadR family transcriptional regulator
MATAASPGVETYDNLLLELRRGVLTLLVLSQLRQEQYGYSLQRALAEQGIEIDQGTLYPLLRRLETQQLLQSRWQVEESRPRRYYIITPAGEQTLHRLADAWRVLVKIAEQLLP